MNITRIEPGARMSQAVVHNGTIYLAGQVGEGADVTEQSKAALLEAERLLAVAGSDKSHILSATIWLSDMSLFAEMNAVWDAWVDPANPPARACGEAKLATPDYLVEFMIVAAVS
ncbi:RidA family protein [Citreicella sp. C3M06]|uniref:RidA family protein n=1 Tax=Roseobacteraceae TaxID=2854170 RepID=UPI001C080AAD|nr:MULTISPECIES: RidA family protein [Roseobacteraceae]MBU2960777.1 RidA family protein [Citreicella sp. C3M06]MDO6588069.1 RidA family protein [Salipiger sp. 1_MG-2023]